LAHFQLQPMKIHLSCLLTLREVAKIW